MPIDEQLRRALIELHEKRGPLTSDEQIARMVEWERKDGKRTKVPGRRWWQRRSVRGSSGGGGAK